MTYLVWYVATLNHLIPDNVQYIGVVIWIGMLPY